MRFFLTSDIFQFSSAHKGSCGEFYLMSYSDSSNELTEVQHGGLGDIFLVSSQSYPLDIWLLLRFLRQIFHFSTALYFIHLTQPCSDFSLLSLERQCRTSFKLRCRMTEAPLLFERQMCLLSIALKISYQQASWEYSMSEQRKKVLSKWQVIMGNYLLQLLLKIISVNIIILAIIFNMSINKK